MTVALLEMNFITGLVETVSLVWMELSMLLVAIFGYVLFHGVPLSMINAKEAPKTIDESGPSEEEKVAQNLQSRLADDDHLAVYCREWEFHVPPASYRRQKKGVPLVSIWT